MITSFQRDGQKKFYTGKVINFRQKMVENCKIEADPLELNNTDEVIIYYL